MAESVFFMHIATPINQKHHEQITKLKLSFWSIALYTLAIEAKTDTNFEAKNNNNINILPALQKPHQNKRQKI